MKKQGKSFEESFLSSLKNCFGENLLSVMIYGSYVRGSFVKGVSDINMLIILEKPDPEQIEVLGRTTHRMIKRHRITPLILTREEFNNSADVFPMEYFDIKDRNRVIHGTDETKSLSLTMTNLRHQIEDRLRGEIASLRQLFIASRGRPRVLRHLLKLWAGSLYAVFRGLLRLKKADPIPVESGDILKKLNEAFSIDTTPFTQINELRSGVKVDPKPLTQNLLGKLEELIRIVDKMKF
ncbi:MAG: nucleotidyltransferase domain-containing protein [Spirochaetota bacterium]|nr:MAG: nucleotidyltransferase domain-containing protein [Spirochaetota bacterium]